MCSFTLPDILLGVRFVSIYFGRPSPFEKNLGSPIDDPVPFRDVLFCPH